MENDNNTYQSKKWDKWLNYKKALNRGVLLIVSLMVSLCVYATIQLPSIPSQADFNRLYEYNSEYAFRVNLGGSYLESGAIIAYVGNQIRGAQTVSEVFPLSGDKVYKLRVYSNSGSGETMTLRYYDIFNDKIYEVTEDISFVADQVPDYSSPQVINAYCPDPVVANLLVPSNNTTDTDTRVTFSWEGSAENSHYGLLLWPDGDPVPTTPFLSNLTGTSRTVYNLLNGTGYHWRIISYNGCSSDTSGVYSFTTRVLPDLFVSDIITSETVESATSFNIQFAVQNLNTGATVESSWYDAVYISQDDVFDNNDLYLGRVRQITPVLGNNSYAGSLDAILPAEYDGPYRIFVVTDVYNNVKETDDANNRSADSDVLTVNRRALPDISITSLSADKASVQPGDSLTISWTVENNTGEDAEGGWTEKVSFNTLSGIKVQLTGSPLYNEVLNAGGSVGRSMRFKVPNTLPFSGDTHIEVVLFPNNALIEEPGGDANNSLVSTSTVNIGSQLYIDIPTSSLVENSTTQLRCKVSRSSNPATSLEVTLSADLPGQITIPPTVIIPASSYSSIFYLSTIDNSILDGSREVQISANAPSHNDTTVTFTVHDNEVVSLNGTFNETEATEGDELLLTITRNLVTNQDVVVDLYSNSARQWSFDSQAIIPANETSVIVPVSITDDDIAELNGAVTMNISSPGMNQSQQVVNILDNDVPGIAMEILNDSISESGGPLATWVIISKTDPVDKAVRVKLSTDIPNALYVQSEVFLPLGTGQKQINLGAIDNALVDGTREVALIGAVYLSSCNCSTTAANGGIASDTITVLDNDGPALTVSFNPLSLAEGREEAGKITVVRNTSTDNPLVVTLSHNDATELSLPPTLTIPQGEVSAVATISTINDNVEDGNQQVSVKAEAEGYTPGVGWVYVTDQNKPDLQPMDLTISSPTVVTGDQIEVKCQILNQGYAPSPTGFEIGVYLSDNELLDDQDEELGQFKLTSPIAADGFTEFWELMTAPEKTGDYYIILKVNPNSNFTELVYQNNQSNPAPVELIPSYTGTAFVDEEQFINPEDITIHGSATSTLGEPLPDAKLDIYLIRNGIRQEIEVTTDESGNYTTLFTPVQGGAGHYIVGACYPDQRLIDAQDEFDILGMQRTGDRYMVWDILFNVDNPGSINMKNLSNIDLTEVVFSTDEVPEGFELEIDTIDVLPGGGNAQFTYNIRGTVLTEGNDYIEIPAQISCTEGITIDFTLYYYCQAQESHIKALPASINTTMTKGKSRLYEFKVYNDGAGETGEVAIGLPDFEWMNLLTIDTLTTIQAGDTVTVTLQLSPGDDIPLNTPISGSIAFNVENGRNLSLPFRIEAVSEETGNLVVDVIDEYTYYTEEAPHVKDAQVVVRHPFSGAVIAEGFTGEDGTFNVNDIPEGSYRMYVQAEKHEGYQGIISIDPGRTNEQSIFLSFQAITYTWEVIPTEIEDEYLIDLIMEFETNVPVPVVVMEMPEVMPALMGDATYTFPVTLTNKGLITANDVELFLPVDAEYEFITNFTTVDLLAQQAIQIPVVMRRKVPVSPPGAELKSTEATQAQVNCRDVFVAVYSWECGENGRWQKTREGFVYAGRVCDGSGIGDVDPIDSNTYSPGPVRGPSGDGYTDPTTGPINVLSPTTASCQECIDALFWALIGCAPGGNAPACLNSFADGISLKDAVLCALGFASGPLGCAASITDALMICFNSFVNGPGGMTGTAIDAHQISVLKNLLETNGDMPPIIELATIDLLYVEYIMEAEIRYIDEYFGSMDWRIKESIIDFMSLVSSYLDNGLAISEADANAIKLAMADTDITSEEIDAFILRWNNTVAAWSLGIYSPNEEYPDIVDKTILDGCFDDAQEVNDYVAERGFEDVNELYDEAIITLNEQVEVGRKSVCASVTIKISQKLTMTREAFEGTLTIFNGNETTAIEEVKLDLQIKDEFGKLSNDLFEIETKALDILTGIDGTGSLAGGQKGSATILFIPEKGAAPIVPASYSFGGTLSYLDPFTGTTVTKLLFPVTLDVHPSPDLTLHYFMQRDILGDDALTKDVVEPVIPAELAVMIENNGYGMAKSVRIESAQPEIIENEKGLAIHFQLIGSNLQGQPAQLGLTNIDFGNINPMSTKIGQWWFTSDLLGHFIDYKTKLTHLDSRGNPDLSLVSGAELHELIKSIRVYGSQEDGINDFLINEVQDSKETPDAIYVSQGQVVLDVEPVRNAVMTGFPTAGSTSLFASPEHIGWNYLKINDPGHGNFSIESVTRVSDGQVIPLDNMWLTHVTLPDGKEPVYEDMLHFVDNFPSMETEEYNVTWKVNQGDAPKIVSITGTPAHMVTEQVTEAIVIFNKPIDASTFTYEDLTLRLQGGADIMNGSVAVTPLDAYSFSIDLTSLTTGEGYYVLTVQANEIYDQFGISGTEGKFVSWTQFLGAPAVEQFIGLPATFAGPPFNTLEIDFNVPVNQVTVTPDVFNVNYNGTQVNDNISVLHVSGDTLFLITGLADLMQADGDYSLEVDLTAVESSAGIYGLIQQTVEWKVDTTNPEIIVVIPRTDNGYDWQHYADMEIEFSEDVTNFSVEQLELWKDGIRQPLSQLHLDELNPGRYLVSQFRLLTYYEGDYTLIIHLEEITDRAGLTGVEPYEFTWTVDRSGAVPVESLRITPDLGSSETDGVTSTRELTAVMNVIQNGSNIEIYINDFGKLTRLATRSNVNAGELAIPIRLPVGGRLNLEVHSLNDLGDPAIVSKTIYVDESSLNAYISGLPTGVSKTHPVSVNIELLSKILETDIDVNLIEITRDNIPVPLPGMTVTKVSDYIFTIGGLDQLHVVDGDFKITVDITQLHKSLSGIAGAVPISSHWILGNTNKAPVANAGDDILITTTGNFYLDGSASFDPDNDDLTYTWYAPEGITLDNPNLVSPGFTIEEGTEDNIYSFILLVDDGKTESTDKVEVIVQIPTGTYEQTQDFDLNVFPNPSDGILYIDDKDELITRIQVFDMQGRSVYIKLSDFEKTTEIDLQNLKSGLYTVILITPKGVVMKKIMIK